jgi:hemolysin activation/secretion protein
MTVGFTMFSKFRPHPICIALGTLLLAHGSAFAQQAPDAGRILQDLQVPQQTLPESLNLQFDTPPAAGAVSDQGPQVQLTSVRFQGASRIDDARLQAVVAPALGQGHSIASLRALADRVTAFYREQGYPFARAYLPAQRMSEGALLIDIIEGRYGRVGTSGNNADVNEQAQRFLAPLKSGEVIANDELERAVLILSDQPGVRIRPVVRPGASVGTGDLDVEVQTTPALVGRLTVDNHGNRYSGQNRVTAEASWNSPFMLGDRLSAALLATDESLYFGQLAYSRPLGAGGWRGDIGYAVSDYTLGAEFASLRATGRAEVASVGASYPLIRSNRANLLLSAQLQHKDMRDEYRTTSTVTDKTSTVLPVSVQFDVRDSWLGGGITYGHLLWTHGRLSLDSPTQRALDALTARTAGSFNKVNLDLTRLQSLPGGFVLSGRVSAQWAGKNLDSSEDFVLGGSTGVRAYPRGEGAGDEGIVGQLELRYGSGALVPYAFWDAGQSTTNRRPWQVSDNHRSLSGGGLGVRSTYGRWSLDGNIAWRHSGGDSISDTQQRDPRVWVSLGYRF